MKKMVTISALMICALMLVSCGKRFVGQEIGYPSENWCDYYRGYYPAFGEGKRCVIRTNHLIFDFMVKTGDAEGDYIIEGTIDATQGSIKSFDHLMSERSHFFMLVGYGNRVVDNVGFRPVAAYGDLGRQLPFRIEYHSDKGFDKVTFGYNISVSG